MDAYSGFINNFFVARTAVRVATMSKPGFVRFIEVSFMLPFRIDLAIPVVHSVHENHYALSYDSMAFDELLTVIVWLLWFAGLEPSNKKIMKCW